MENLLRELREQQGMTQQELANKLHVSRQTVISLERGKYNPSLNLAFTISRLFGVTIEEVFKYHDQMD